MKKKTVFWLFVPFILFFISCEKNDIARQQTAQKLPKVIVSVPPYIYFVKKIAEDTVDVQAMIPPNSNPHLFEPTPQQTALATQADIWFKIGEAFEKYLIDFLKKNNSELIVSDLREKIDLIPYEKSTHACHDHLDFKDVHIWTSPRLAKIQAETIARALIEKYPQNRDLYSKNLSTFLKELDLLDYEIGQKLSSFKEKAFLISHPAFGYFCKDYGINQISIEYQGKDPTLKKLGKIFDEAKERNIKKVFVQAQYNNKGAAFIAEKLGLDLELIDPYSVNYEATLRKLADLLIKE